MREPWPPAKTRPVVWSRVGVVHGVCIAVGTPLAADVAHFNAFALYRGDWLTGCLALVFGKQALGAQFGIAVGALAPNLGNAGADVGIAAAIAQQAAQIPALVGKQAQVKLPLGREAGTVATATKSLRHAADDPHLAQGRVVLPLGIGVAPALGGLAWGRG